MALSQQTVSDDCQNESISDNPFVLELNPGM